jgi:hypothetical protein
MKCSAEPYIEIYSIASGSKEKTKVDCISKSTMFLTQMALHMEVQLL